MTPTSSWLTLDAGERVWYIIGSGGVHLDVFLEAKPLDGMTLEVYAPGQLDQPIGHGTFQAATGRLVWAGGHWQSEGDWLARVTNGNPVSAQADQFCTGHQRQNALQLLGKHRNSACLLDRVSITAILFSLGDSCLARFAGAEMLTRGTFASAETLTLKVKAPVV